MPVLDSSLAVALEKRGLYFIIIIMREGMAKGFSKELQISEVTQNVYIYLKFKSSFHLRLFQEREKEGCIKISSTNLLKF